MFHFSLSKKHIFALSLSIYAALALTACAHKGESNNNNATFVPQTVIIYQGCAQGYHRHTQRATAQAQAEIAGQRVQADASLTRTRQHQGCYADSQAHDGHLAVSLTASLQTDTPLDPKQIAPIKAVATPIMRPSLPQMSIPMPMPRGGMLR